ncbi:hypothetical protein [Niastella sp. OAS944]|nr:hypothetical protein [Chitinophagaceae bacterium OAS944]
MKSHNHQNYMGRLVVENGSIKLIREAPIGTLQHFPPHPETI